MPGRENLPMVKTVGNGPTGIGMERSILKGNMKREEKRESGSTGM